MREATCVFLTGATKVQTPQEGVAERVRQLGAGILLEDVSPDAIRSFVDTLLTDTAYRTKAGYISDGFRNCGGASAAADKIEECCKNRIEKCP